MAISFDNALGIHQQALEFRAKRAEVLANNLANADTPGFKARDFDFKALLSQAVSNQTVSNQVGARSKDGMLPMQTTDGKHLPHGELETADALLYRTSVQPSIDGNTVDSQQELASFMKNTLDFQASFQFLNSKFKGLMTAIRGE